MTAAETDRAKKIEMLIQAIDRLYPPTWVLIWRSFIQGIFVGLGTTLGVSIILALATFTVSKLKLVPLIQQIIIQSNIEAVFPKNQ